MKTNWKKRTLAMVACLMVSVAVATDYQWLGGASSEWTSSASWSPNTGYPNGADDTATFANAEATSVTVTGDVTVRSISFSGSRPVTFSGSSIELGKGLYSTSATEDAIVTISNALAITDVQTVVSNSMAAVHLHGIVSGTGGFLKGGAARLHLHGANTFSGGLEAEGTKYTPKGVKTSSSGTLSADNRTYTLKADVSDSSGVVIYHVQALGTGKAVFDKNYTTDTSSGTRLTVYGCTGTIVNDIQIPNDYEATNKTRPYGCEIYGGDVTFSGKISCKHRAVIRVLTWNSVRFTQTISHTNYLQFFPVVEDSKVYMDAAMSGSCETLGAGKTYLTAASASSVNLFLSSCLVMEGENVLPSNLQYDFYWQNNNAVVDLNGYDQKITTWVYKKTPKKWVDAQITSPEGSPAQIFCRTGTDNDWACRFTGSAGFVWNPTDSAKTLYVTNSISTTCGEIGVTNGTVRLACGTIFTRLGKLSVEKGATFNLGADAGATFKTAKLRAAEGAVFALEGGKCLKTGKMHVIADDGSTTEVPSGTTLTAANAAEQGIVITGTGSIYVTGEGVSTYWKGAEGGLWSEAANWSSGSVPDGDCDVYVTNATTVAVDAAITPVHALYLGDGTAISKIVVSNMNSTLSADEIVVADKALITCGAAATNETDLSRVHVVCRNLMVAKGGAIDVSKKGWAGGIWELKHDDVAKHAVHAAGFGPGAPTGNGYGGATHGGRGASTFLDSTLPRVPYGSAAEPVTAGSGGDLTIGWGGTEIGYFLCGAAGGGIVRIEATGTVSVDGAILADGASCACADNRDTPGAGGSIWITCRNIVGEGTVRAAGGKGDEPRIPVLHYYCQNATDTDIKHSPAAGGGRISINYNPDAQAVANPAGLMISAAAGEYAKGDLGLARRDNEETAAEPGTLHFTDTTLVRQLFGNGLSGRIVGLKSLAFDGNLDFTRGFIQPMEEGFTLTVAGDLRISGDEARLEVGGVCLTNLASHATTWGGRQLNKLVVGGDLTVEKGGSFLLRAAETNATMRWGAEAQIAGTFTVGSNGYAYAACDGRNLAAPMFAVGSLVIDRYGTFSANRRGGLGADAHGIGDLIGWSKNYIGFGFGGGENGASASHGGLGSLGWLGDASTGSAPVGIVAELYDDAWLPTMPGSGGGSVSPYFDAGTGGGVIYVVASGAVVLDGTVSADGWCGNSFYSKMQMMNAGSGGTVFICGETVTGGAHARITAKGGSAMQSRGTGWSATGGGGRIAIWTGAPNFLAGKCHKNRHDTKPAALLGSVSAETGDFLYPAKGAVEMPEGVAEKISGSAGTVHYGAFEPPAGLAIIVR